MNQATIDRLAQAGQVGIWAVEDALNAAYGNARRADDLDAMAKIEAAIAETEALHKTLEALVPPRTRIGGGK